MANEIIAYLEMCRREGMSLQRGMNFRIRGNHSVLLMSVRANAPYEDRLEGDGSILTYEGHDEVRTKDGPNPKSVDQPRQTRSGKLTQNGLFEAAALRYKAGLESPERVRVYEKIREGIWSYNGLFYLVDAWVEPSEQRSVFKFRLEAISEPDSSGTETRRLEERRRIIPTAVKLKVWQRDKGKCVLCGADSELHFDHDVPYALGGTSLTEDNVQLLCARHNLSKGARIR